MNILKQIDAVEFIKQQKLAKNFENLNVNQLIELDSFNGIAEFKFNNLTFYMLNIAKDDGVVLKYLWKDKYENLALNLWYKLTREEGFCIDIGAHTGIYSIIGSLNKKLPLMISIEPYFLNYVRLLDNLKINSFNLQHCFLFAASNQNGTMKFEASTNAYHTSAGKISDKGSMSVNTMMIDSINFTKKVTAIKVDTEGHEFNVLEGAKRTIQNNKPEILFEINKECFNLCTNFLKQFGYRFYFVCEEKKELFEIDEFDKSFIRDEGSNCFATLKELPLILGNK